MKRCVRVAVGCLAAAVVAACSPPKGKCGGVDCGGTERCDTDALRCVPDLPPVVSISPPTGVVSEPTYEVTGSVTDDDRLTAVEWRSGAREWTALTLEPEGAFRVTLDAAQVDAQPVVFSVRARDAIQETNASAEVRIDRVAPAVVLVFPDAGVAVSAAVLDVGVKATDGSGALSEFTLNGVAQPLVSGSTSIVSLPIAATANYEALSVAVVAADSRGNRATTSFTFYGDRVPPEVTITAPTANQWVNTPTLTATFTATDPGTVVSATCAITGATAAATLVAGVWTCTLPTEVVERVEQLTVTAFDAAGNSASRSVDFQLDRIPPTINMVTPTGGQIFGAPFPLHVETSPADAVFWRFAGANGALGPGPTVWDATVPVPAHDFGPETLEVEAVDDAGNSVKVTVNLFTDTVAPVITFTQPVANQRFNIASFASGDTNVRTAWTVTDGDPLAVTATVNGAVSTQLQLDRATSPTDNPQSYTNTIAASDRAGNFGVASISYTVDRVAPTVASWAPADATRNFAPRETVMTFSEPVQSPSGPPVTVTPPGALVSSFDATRQVWTGGLQGYALTPITMTLQMNVVDDHGNPVTPAPAPRRFYVGTDRAPNATVLLSSNASEFDATSDADGITTIAFTSGGMVTVLRDDGSMFAPLTTNIARTDSVTVSVNSWNVVNPTTLASSMRHGLVVFGLSSWTRWSSVDGTLASDTGSTPQVGVVSKPGMGFPPLAPSGTQPFEGSAAIGNITNATFVRSPKTWPLAYTNSGTLHVLQSTSSWIAVNNTAAALEWARFYCSSNMFTGLFCESTLYRSNDTGFERGSAITRSGSCAALAWSNRLVFQTPPACEASGSGCTSNLNVPFSTRSNSERFAPWDANGEDTLLVAYRAGDSIGVRKMAPGTCGLGNLVNVVAPVLLPGTTMGGPGPTDFLPVRVGTHVGLVYRVGTFLYVRILN